MSELTNELIEVYLPIRQLLCKLSSYLGVPLHLSILLFRFFEEGALNCLSPKSNWATAHRSDCAAKTVWWDARYSQYLSFLVSSWRIVRTHCFSARFWNVIIRLTAHNLLGEISIIIERYRLLNFGNTMDRRRVIHFKPVLMDIIAYWNKIWLRILNWKSSHFLTQFRSNQNFIQLLSLRHKRSLLRRLRYWSSIVSIEGTLRIRILLWLVVAISRGLKLHLDLLLARWESHVNFWKLMFRNHLCASLNILDYVCHRLSWSIDSFKLIILAFFLKQL